MRKEWYVVSPPPLKERYEGGVWEISVFAAGKIAPALWRKGKLIRGGLVHLDVAGGAGGVPRLTPPA